MLTSHFVFETWRMKLERDREKTNENTLIPRFNG